MEQSEYNGHCITRAFLQTRNLVMFSSGLHRILGNVETLNYCISASVKFKPVLLLLQYHSHLFVRCPWDPLCQPLASYPAQSYNMLHEYDSITVIELDSAVVLRLPDRSSVEVPQDTIRRSDVLQEALQTSDTGGSVSLLLPRGVLHNWLQGVEALQAAAASTGHGPDIARNPRLLQFLVVRCFIQYGFESILVCLPSCRWQLSLIHI